MDEIPAFAGTVIKLTTDYIHANLAQTLTLKELSAIANISRFHFTRVFKRMHGIGPARYVQLARVAEAKRLMAASRLSLAEVALVVGFSDQSHFTRCFKQIVGVTPSCWNTQMGFHPGRRRARSMSSPIANRPAAAS